MAPKTVLLVGARGSLGGKVLDAVLQKSKDGGIDGVGKYKVKTLIRPGSNADKVEALGVEVVRGDMMDATSLEVAFQGVDVVINTANGYGQGHPEIDVQGARNVADAVKVAKVSRYVYCSILTCEKTGPDVEHFWHKHGGEEYLKEKEIPFVALRPGLFLDQSDDYLGDAIVGGKSFAICMWDKTVPVGMVYTPDLAKLFADAIDLPDDANGKSIEVGWSRPISYEEVVSICSTKVDRKLSCYGLPKIVRYAMMYTIGWFSPFMNEMIKMFNYFDTGLYVNTDTETQSKYFGAPPTPEDVIGRYVDKLMETKE